MQNLLLCASQPTIKPAPSAIKIGACCEPGPLVEKNIGAFSPNLGATNKNARRDIAIKGIIIPANFGFFSEAPSENPFHKNKIPIKIPTINPPTP